MDWTDGQCLTGLKQSPINIAFEEGSFARDKLAHATIQLLSCTCTGRPRTTGMPAMLAFLAFGSLFELPTISLFTQLSTPGERVEVGTFVTAALKETSICLEGVLTEVFIIRVVTDFALKVVCNVEQWHE